MKLAATISLSAGGPGSGCNPTKGKCGRSEMGNKKEGGVLDKSGWYKDGKFFPLSNYNEMHDTAAIKSGLAGPHPRKTNKLVNDYEEVVKEAFQNGAIRIQRIGDSYDLEAWKKDDMREALSRLPENAREILIEWRYPKHDGENYDTKESAMNHLYAAAKKKKK